MIMGATITSIDGKRGGPGIPPELLGMNLAGLRAEMAQVTTAAVLDTLRSVPDCVAVTLRRELGGRTWDIRLGCTYWATIADGGKREQVIVYDWEATECLIGEDDDLLPDEIVCRLTFETPEEALADAETALAQREAS